MFNRERAPFSTTQWGICQMTEKTFNITIKLLMFISVALSLALVVILEVAA